MGADFWTNATIISTPNAKRSAEFQALAPPAQKLLIELAQFEQVGSVDCNQSLTSASHCLICNCGNEAGNNASLENYAKISKVVFSRVKSSQYPNTVCGVTCDKSQFAWTIGTYNEQCKRTTRAKPKYFNRPQLSGQKFTQCINSIRVAAKDQLVDHPNDIFALNYLNPGASSDKSWLAKCRRTKVGPKSGGHLFCNPYLKREPYPTLQSDAIAYRGPYRHDS